MEEKQKRMVNKKKDSKVEHPSYDYSGSNRIYNNGRGKTAHRTVIRLVKLLDVIIVSIPFTLAWYFYYAHRVYQVNFYRKGNWVVVALFTVLYYLFSHLYSGYTIHISRISEIIYAQSLGAVIADGLMFVIMWLLMRHIPYDSFEQDNREKRLLPDISSECLSVIY